MNKPGEDQKKKKYQNVSVNLIAIIGQLSSGFCAN
jgi:hypothetical protein